MQRVTVNAWQIGLVFKNEEYVRMITTGTYWFWKGEQVYKYDITQPFAAPTDLRLLLENEELKSVLDVVEVGDGQLVLRFENGLLKQVLTTGIYAFWKSILKNRFVRVNTGEADIPEEVDRNLFQHPLLVPYLRSLSVEPYERAALFIDGRLVRILVGGTYYWWKNSSSIVLVRIDTRVQQLEINGQEILTRDKAALRLNAWAQYAVENIEQAVLANKAYDQQLYVALQLALREYVGGFTLDELLEKKEELAAAVKERVEAIAAGLGVSLVSFGVRDIILPGEVRAIMNQVLVAEKKAQANSILRREETAQTRSLLNTARLMEDNAILWKMKEMEYVERIAEKISSISIQGNGALLDQLKGIFTKE